MNDVLFLGCQAAPVIPGRPVVLGCPLDVTCTYRRGAADAPHAIRVASDSIETYSPLLDDDLADNVFCDAGDIAVPSQRLEEALDSIEGTLTDALSRGGRPLVVGGEHTITLPAVKAFRKVHSDFYLIHLDAHSDLRNNYEGSTINHATVIRRIADIIGPRRLIQLGIRAGTREEFTWMRSNGTLIQWGPRTAKLLEETIQRTPIYLTLDLDVLDPACFTGTGNPEPGGWFYDDMEQLLRVLTGMNLLAADVVELNPGLDPSQTSTITAAKIIRELLLILGRNDEA
jgi:agmatinase